MAATDEDEHEPELRFRGLPRDHARLDTLDLFSRVLERTGVALGDRARIDRTAERLRDEMVSVAEQRSTLHGWRAQALFEGVVASLGEVALLKQEDVGDVFFSGPDLKVPDFRIVTASGEQYLVEVKSFMKKQPRAPFTVRRKDVEELQRYVETLPAGQLRYAIYWAAWNLWTLVPITVFEPNGPRHLRVDLPSAAKANEMGLIGDRTLGTNWPLRFTILSDQTKERAVDPSGEANFAIGSVEVRVAGRIIDDPDEQGIAMRLMQFGGWDEETEADVVDGGLVSMSYTFAPARPPDDPQDFALHGPLSSLYSAMFVDATTTSTGEISDLRVVVDPGGLRELIPDNFEGKELKIWRFRLTPSSPSPG